MSDTRRTPANEPRSWTASSPTARASKHGLAFVPRVLRADVHPADTVATSEHSARTSGGRPPPPGAAVPAAAPVAARHGVTSTVTGDGRASGIDRGRRSDQTRAAHVAQPTGSTIQKLMIR